MREIQVQPRQSGKTLQADMYLLGAAEALEMLANKMRHGQHFSIESIEEWALRYRARRGGG